jgi:hypothetical protein
VGLRTRYLPCLACAAVVAVAIPTFAFGDAAPPLTGSIKAVDFGFQNLADTSSDSVTIAAGGTVTFSYSSGSSFHNVASDGPAPASPAASVSVPSEVSGNVNPTLSISLSSSASLGSFTAGLAQDYETTVPATVSSSAGDATLSVADGSATASGHLVNGSFALAQPVQARATNAAHPSSAFARSARRR